MSTRQGSRHCMTPLVQVAPGSISRGAIQHLIPADSRWAQIEFRIRPVFTRMADEHYRIFLRAISILVDLVADSLHKIARTPSIEWPEKTSCIAHASKRSHHTPATTSREPRPKSVAFRVAVPPPLSASAQIDTGGVSRTQFGVRVTTIRREIYAAFARSAITRSCKKSKALGVWVIDADAEVAEERSSQSISSPAHFAYALMPALLLCTSLPNFATPSRFLARAAG